MSWGRGSKSLGQAFTPIVSSLPRPASIREFDPTAVQLREVRTQAELADAVAAGVHPVLRGFEQFLIGAGMLVTARDTTIVYALDDAWVIAWDRASTILAGNALAICLESASADVTGDATAYGHGESDLQIVPLKFLDGTDRPVGNATVHAYGRTIVTAVDGTVEAHDDSWVDAKGASTVHADGRARVQVNGDPDQIVVIRDDAMADLRSGTLTAHDRAVVQLDDGSQYGAAAAPVLTTLGSQVHVLVVDDLPIHGDCRTFDPANLTPHLWAQLYRVPVRDDGTVTLYTTVKHDWTTLKGPPLDPHIQFRPGPPPATLPQRLEQRPRLGLDHHRYQDGSHFLACHVALTDIEMINTRSLPHLVSATRIAPPGVWEVDIHGQPL